MGGLLLYAASHWQFLGVGQYCVLQLRLQWDWKNIGCSPGSANYLHRAPISINNRVLWKATIAVWVCEKGEGAPTGTHWSSGKWFLSSCHIRWKISAVTSAGWSCPVLKVLVEHVGKLLWSGQEENENCKWNVHRRLGPFLWNFLAKVSQSKIVTIKWSVLLCFSSFPQKIFAIFLFLAFCTKARAISQ